MGAATPLPNGDAWELLQPGAPHPVVYTAGQIALLAEADPRCLDWQARRVGETKWQTVEAAGLTHPF